MLTLADGIAAMLREKVMNGTYSPGSRIPSQNDLAREYQTSSLTIREAVGQLVQEGLLDRRFGSGTYVTGRQPERFVAIFSEMNLVHPAASPSFLATMQAARRYLESVKIPSRFYIGQSEPFGSKMPKGISSWDFLHDFEAKRILGVVAVATGRWLVEQVVGPKDIPVVASDEIDGVPLLDVTQMVRTGVNALAGRGCRRVACISLTLASNGEGHSRLFETLCREQNLITRPEWLVALPFNHEHGDGVTAFESIWKNPENRPEGLLVLDDMLYIDMCSTFLSEGIRIPEDLVVVSQATIPSLHAWRPEPVRLTIDVEAIGRVMAQNLVCRLKDPSAPPQGVPVPIQVLDIGALPPVGRMLTPWSGLASRASGG